MVRRAVGPEIPVARTGASPSGKAADFDSAIRRFESSRPSHCCNSSFWLFRYLNTEPFQSNILQHDVLFFQLVTMTAGSSMQHELRHGCAIKLLHQLRS